MKNVVSGRSMAVKVSEAYSVPHYYGKMGTPPCQQLNVFVYFGTSGCRKRPATDISNEEWYDSTLSAITSLSVNARHATT